jgi:hypothetical protein
MGFHEIRRGVIWIYVVIDRDKRRRLCTCTRYRTYSLHTAREIYGVDKTLLVSLLGLCSV